MSELGRKSFHTKIGERITPSIFKSKSSKVTERATDAADIAAREGQPDRAKSFIQATADKLGRAKDKILHGGSAGKTGDKTKRKAHWKKTRV